jgi:hypothetical protein
MSNVLMLRCTSTLSITTWKNSGETSPNSAHEPGDVEAPRQVGQRAPLGHQHQPPTPHRLELLAGQLAGPLERRLDQQFVLADLAQQQVAAVVQDGERRHRRPGEPAPGRAEGPDFEAVILGAAQHVGHANRVRANPMADLRRVRRYPLELHHHDKRSQAGIRSLLRTRRHQCLPFRFL